MGQHCCKESHNEMEDDRNLPADMYQKKAEQNSERTEKLVSSQKFKNQDFDYLRDYCLKNGFLFEDDTFPAHISSIGPKVLSEDTLRHIEWRRPTVLGNDPSLFVDGVSRSDIFQGKVGDCWVLAALGSVIRQRRFLEHIIPKDQGFKHKYAGIFHFQFWQFGNWVDVVIDDRLPFFREEYVFVRPSNQHEFWPPLLEKAYAKLRGSYSKIHWGYLEEALVDFTGGVQLSIDLRNPSRSVFEMLETASASNCLMGCTSPGAIQSKNSPANTVLKNGIVQGHAYTIVQAAEVPYKNRNEYIIRLWNPYGNTEWNGAWSDGSMEWDHVPNMYKEALYKVKDRGDGEFWISYEDFKSNFSFICVCNDLPTFLDFGKPSSTIWSTNVHFNYWTQEHSAKGAFSRKTPYYIQIQEPEMRNDNIVVALSQNCVNYARIDIQIAKVEPEGRTVLNQMYPKKARDITRHFKLSPGTYIIIPTMSSGDRQTDFLLRIFLKKQKQNNLRESYTSTEVSQAITKDIHTWNQDNSYETVFLRYANQSSQLNASELQRILNEVVLKDLMASLGNRDRFSFDSSKSLLALMDTNANGSLTLDEFGRLWQDLNRYKEIFIQEDGRNSGFLSVSSLKRLIEGTGLWMNHKLLQLMAVRYGDSSMKLNFPDFACCMIRLETMAKVFHNLSRDEGQISFTKDQWFTMIMYC